MKKNILISLLFIFITSTVAACGSNKKLIELEINTSTTEDLLIQEIDNDKTGISNPGGLCLYNNNIFVCDTTNNCIVQFNKNLERLNTYGTLGMENGNFSTPIDIIFSDGCFYVLDSGNNRVQKFTSKFTYLETYNLEPLLSEQGLGQYLSIAVNEFGTIFVSVISPDNNDAFIFYFNENMWKKIGTNLTGYLCNGKKQIYFANMLEFHIEDRQTYIESGINILYEIKNGNLNEMARFKDKYVPIALTYWDESIYMISAGEGLVNRYVPNSNSLDLIFTLPDFSLFMDMCIDNDGNFYITDSENGKFFIATRN